MQEKENFRYFDLIGTIFVVVLLVSNIASTKIAQVGRFNFDAGTVLFPISYIFGDILTEVYGYQKARRIIWLGFFCLILAALTFALVQYLPPAQNWPNQPAYEAILGFVPRLVMASMVAYFLGEFANSYILAKMKIYSQGKRLWARTIGSTIFGQLADSAVFSLIAFYGVLPLSLVINIAGTIYIFKVLYEILATPLTYWIVNFLKRAENSDFYDNQTNFNPFKF